MPLKKPVVTIKVELPVGTATTTLNTARSLAEKLLEVDPGISIKTVAVNR